MAGQNSRFMGGPPMGMGMRQEGRQYMGMEQRLVMTPRVRETVDEGAMRARALLPQRRQPAPDKTEE